MTCQGLTASRSIAGSLTAALMLWASVSRAEQTIAPTPNLTQAVQNGWLNFGIVAGRVAIAWADFDSINKTFQEDGRTERFNLDAVNRVPSLQYQRVDAAENLSLTLIGSSQVRIVRSGVDEKTAIVPVQFSQAPGESIVLVVGPESDRHEYKAANLWELLIVEPEVCSQHLIPLLDLLRRHRDLNATTRAIENELVAAAMRGEAPNCVRWTALVAQLGDDRFGKREAADRELRAAGPVAMGFLHELDLQKLDAEQRFRLKRIFAALSNDTADDSPEQIALSLVANKPLWIALMERDDVSIRKIAAEHAAAILGRAITFDPNGPADVRKAQLARLRETLRLEADEAAKAKAQSLPTED